MHSRHVMASVFTLLIFGLVAAAGCTAKSTGVRSVWPVATYEATVTPPASVFALPLSGLQPQKGSLIPTVPVCVKVRNDGKHALTGVAQADVVYETADSERGTQLACLYQSGIPDRIGPLSSAGMPDLWIVPQYHAMLFSTGAISNLAASMRLWPKPSNASRKVGPPFSSAYQGGSQAKYVLGRKAARLAEKHSSQITSQTPARLRFSKSSQATSTPIKNVTVPFPADLKATWKWDEVSGTYLRSVEGKPSRDNATHKRISATNVVVLWVRYASLDPDLAGEGGVDVTLGGSGQASIFRDGMKHEGRWKANGQSPPRLLARDGRSIGLEPGATWFEVIPLSTNITLR